MRRAGRHHCIIAAAATLINAGLWRQHAAQCRLHRRLRLLLWHQFEWRRRVLTVDVPSRPMTVIQMMAEIDSLGCIQFLKSSTRI
jgi:hypothetical protein